jgi:hypothetical protein
MRLCSFASRLYAVARRPSPVVRCFRPIGRCPIPIPSRPGKDVVARPVVTVEIVQAGQLITTFGAAIAKLGRLIAALRRFQSGGGCLVAHRRHEVTIVR